MLPLYFVCSTHKARYYNWLWSIVLFWMSDCYLLCTLSTPCALRNQRDRDNFRPKWSVEYKQGVPGGSVFACSQCTNFKHARSWLVPGKSQWSQLEVFFSLYYYYIILLFWSVNISSFMSFCQCGFLFIVTTSILQSVTWIDSNLGIINLETQ